MKIFIFLLLFAIFLVILFISKNSYNPNIIIIGDSFTQPLSINGNESWSNILSRKFNNTINIGKNGYSPLRELSDTKDNIIKYKPRYVLFGVYYNDFYDDSAIVGKNMHIDNVYPEFVSVEVSSSGTKKSIQFNIKSSITESKSVSQNSGVTENAISESKRIVEKNNATFILILFPSKEHVYYELFKQHVNYSEEIFGMPRSEILEICKREKIECVDIYSEFLKHAQNGEFLYFDKDSHMNSIGHKIVADIVLNKMDWLYFTDIMRFF